MPGRRGLQGVHRPSGPRVGTKPPPSPLQIGLRSQGIGKGGFGPKPAGSLAQVLTIGVDSGLPSSEAQEAEVTTANTRKGMAQTVGLMFVKDRQNARMVY